MTHLPQASLLFVLAVYLAQLLFLSSILHPFTSSPLIEQPDHTPTLFSPCSPPSFLVSTLCPLSFPYTEVTAGLYLYDDTPVVCVDEDEVIPSVMPLTSATCDATNTLINNLVNDIIGNNGVEEVKEKPVIVVESMGRLGNELFQYFSTLGVAKSFDATPCFPPGSFSDLTAMYPSIHTNSSCPTDIL
jgi:hypothetical protein